jgi:microcystin-dependent protein
VQLVLGTMQSAGGGAAHANIQPFEVINFNIALFGIFPSRN